MLFKQSLRFAQYFSTGVVRTQLPSLWPFGASLSVASVQPSRSTNGANKYQAYRVTLYANGALDGGMEAELPAGLCDSKDVSSKLAAWAWAARASSGAINSNDDGLPCNGCTLYDATARRIERCADVRHTSTKDPGAQSTASRVDLWVVPPGKWFVYPTGSLGRAVTIPRVPPPKGSKFPITVETISHSPRVFHLHNFLTEAESDALIEHALNNKDPILGLQRSTTGAEHQVSFNQVKRTSMSPSSCFLPLKPSLLSSLRHDLLYCICTSELFFCSFANSRARHGLSSFHSIVQPAAYRNAPPKTPSTPRAPPPSRFRSGPRRCWGWRPLTPR